MIEFLNYKVSFEKKNICKICLIIILYVGNMEFKLNLIIIVWKIYNILML